MFTGMVIYLARIFGFYSWIKLSHFITLTTTRKKYCSAENTVHYYGDFQKVLRSDVFRDPPVFNDFLVLYYTEFGNYFDHIAHSKSSKRQHIRVQQPLKHTNTGLKYF